MNVGVVFVSTGGNKIVRAVRSLRRTEPTIPVHIVFDINSRTWREGGSRVDFGNINDVRIRHFENRFHINGALNEGMRWVKELGCTHACLFHDDIIFSPFKEHIGHLSTWFWRLDKNPKLLEASALTLSLMETGIKGEDGDLYTGRKSQAEWDAMDLESYVLWQKLLPGGKVPGKHMNKDGKDLHELHGSDFNVRYYCGDLPAYSRLGPTGQIVPVATWEAIGGFDEQYGIHYDAYYPAECAFRGLPPVRVIPNIPHLHLHNQSIGYLDPSVDLWGNVSAAFDKRYGKNFWDGKI